MNITKKGVTRTLNVLNFCAGVLVMAYFGYRIYTKQYSITDSLLEYCLSMHYDFKILSAHEDSFYRFVGMTREGKKVNFKICKVWNLEGRYAVGDSIYKEAGDSALYLIKPNGKILLPMVDK